ncbi:MAG: DUF3619 family protein [Gammaproteobacteria bacterium]|nr:DUF3619 family protein [Gammaproteobacteria bacterium]MDH5650315.1 DUF3619 family protein [Gammaproteobacteria bacterium]
MSQQDNDKQLLQQITQQLDDSVEHLDAATLSRLNQARQQALQQGKRKRFGLTPLLAMGSATTAAVVLTVSIVWVPTATNSLAMEDLPMLVAGEELEMFQDLEFYQWLADETRHG